MNGAVVCLAGNTRNISIDSFRARCSSLSCGSSCKRYGLATVTSATFVDRSEGSPEHCMVVAVQTGRPELEMVALLPRNWTGGLVHRGGGGLDGSIPEGDFWTSVQPLNQGMSIIASNGGHRANSGGSGVTLANNAEAMLDYSYRAIGMTYEFGWALISDFYKRAPNKRYFMGCSRGGTEAMKAAAQYPNHYDGIIAQAPAPHMAAFVARIASYPAMEALEDKKWQAVYNAYVEQCDELDGLKDGVVSNRVACRFDPSRLSFLTASELRTVEGVTSNLELADGTVIDRRYWWGSQSGVFAALAELGKQWMWYPILNDPGYDPKAYDVNKYWPRIVAGTRPYSLDVKPDELSTFLKLGKKMLIFMGVDDPTLSIDDTVSFEKRVQALSGDAAANTQMYLLPGVHHCGYRMTEYRGAETADMLGALRLWVERGVVPVHLIAKHVDAGGHVINARPLCPIGTYPKYLGRGNPDDAASFTCQRDGT
jgi:pimeloyl-ACP methyl ester carboxylesterase